MDINRNNDPGYFDRNNNPENVDREDRMEEDADLILHHFRHPVSMIRYPLVEHQLLRHDIWLKMVKATEHENIRTLRQEIIQQGLDEWWEYRAFVDNQPLFDWDRHHYVLNRFKKMLMNDSERPVTRSTIKWFRKRSMEFVFLHVDPDGTCRFNDGAYWNFIWDREAQGWDAMAASVEDPAIKEWYQQFADRLRRYKIAMQTEIEGGDEVEYDMSSSKDSPISHLL